MFYLIARSRGKGPPRGEVLPRGDICVHIYVRTCVSHVRPCVHVGTCGRVCAQERLMG